jgi:hypothetical protein
MNLALKFQRDKRDALQAAEKGAFQFRSVLLEECKSSRM